MNQISQFYFKNNQSLGSNFFDLNIRTKVPILIYEKVQTLVWISKSFEIFESFQISGVQKFTNHFPIPFLNFAHLPDRPTLPSVPAHLTAAQSGLVGRPSIGRLRPAHVCLQFLKA
jgi:hypothetical protein